MGTAIQRNFPTDKRVAMSWRVSPEMKTKLIVAADRNCRSLSQEIEFRLEKSFFLDEVIAAAASLGMQAAE